MYPQQPQYQQYPTQTGYPAYPQAPQSYPQAPQQVQPPQQSQFVMPNMVEPTGGGGGDIAPLPRHLIGRAVIILPTAYDPNNKTPNGGIKPRATVDFVVANIDPQGNPLPPIEYGDSQARDSTARPNCLRLDAPVAEFTGAWWTNDQVVKALAPLVGSGNIMLARLRLGDSTNRPPLLEPLAQDDVARQALSAAWQQRTLQPGSLKRSVGAGITEINGGPPARQPADPAQVAQQYGSAAQQAHYGGPPMPPQPGAQVHYPMPPQPGQGPAAGMPAAAAQAGWTQAAWDAAPPNVKAAFGG